MKTKPLKLGPSTRALLPLYRDLDAQMRAATKVLESPCGAGCSHCCEQLVGASTVEIAAIAEHLAAPERAATRAAVLEAAKPLADIAATFEAIYAELGPIATAWWLRRLPCPLLDPTTKRCLAYEVRPVACRTWAVAGHGPERCETRPSAEVGFLNVYVANREEIIGRVNDASISAHTALDAELLPIGLVKALGGRS